MKKRRVKVVKYCWQCGKKYLLVKTGRFNPYTGRAEYENECPGPHDGSCGDSEGPI